MTSFNSKFPGPKYNNIIENDPQIVKINETHMDWGARPSAMPKSIKNNQVIEHVGSNE